MLQILNWPITQTKSVAPSIQLQDLICGCHRDSQYNTRRYRALTNIELITIVCGGPLWLELLFLRQTCLVFSRWICVEQPGSNLNVKVYYICIRKQIDACQSKDHCGFPSLISNWTLVWQQNNSCHSYKPSNYKKSKMQMKTNAKPTDMSLTPLRLHTPCVNTPQHWQQQYAPIYEQDVCN